MVAGALNRLSARTKDRPGRVAEEALRRAAARPPYRALQLPLLCLFLCAGVSLAACGPKPIFRGQEPPPPPVAADPSPEETPPFSHEEAEDGEPVGEGPELAAGGDDEESTASPELPPAPTLAERVEEAARPWLGTGYRWGSLGGRGIDCSAFTQRVLGQFGVALPRTVSAQQLIGEPVSLQEVGPGDLVFFRLRPSARVNHVGVALDEERFVHASTSRGVVVDHMMDRYYARRFAGARRVLASAPDASEAAAETSPEASPEEGARTE